MIQTRIAIFASGNGSNALTILEHFRDHSSIAVAYILTNNSTAKVIENTKAFGISQVICTNEEAASGAFLIEKCSEFKVDYIILAGFLRKIPVELIQAFPERIINVHPALLPKFGGKGMYGMHVHQAVFEQKESVSGITIHFVNEEFDKGRIIAQFKCQIESTDTPEDIQQKVQKLEHTYFASVIEKTITL